ncbi:MAG: flagellar biosynthesis regulator FlaF [Rhodospirillales bacterium]|nr:flagellar biosynthesis regulator FlaF [Rhodospirillales bacterium]
MSNERAVNTYNQQTKRGGAPRESEGRALLEAARRMAEAQKTPDNPGGLREAARLNWKLWTIFQAELAAPDCPVPAEIRQNMLNLCNFVDKRMVEVLAAPKPEQLDVLINVNRQIAAGLLAAPEQAAGGGTEGTGGGQGGGTPPQPGSAGDLSV